MFDKFNAIVEILKKYEFLADEVLNGDYSNVDFIAVHGEDGDYDRNYENRKRLVNLIPAIRQELIQESIIKRLFIAEIDSCRYSSFGGYDSTLETLTAMLWQFNDDKRYDGLFEEAKNANFDCLCGYRTEKGAYSYDLGIDFIKKMSPGDCLNYIYFDLYEVTNIEFYLDWVEQAYSDDIDELEKIKYINECLDRKSHNYKYHLIKLDNALHNNSEWDISASYNNVIDSIISVDMMKAYYYFEKAIPHLFLIDEWYECGLGRAFIMFAAIFIIDLPAYRSNLWADWKQYIIAYLDDDSDIGNMCKKASEIVAE